MKMKKVISTVLGAAMLLSSAVCFGAPAVSAAETSDEPVVSIDFSDADSFDDSKWSNSRLNYNVLDNSAESSGISNRNGVMQISTPDNPRGGGDDYSRVRYDFSEYITGKDYYTISYDVYFDPGDTRVAVFLADTTNRNNYTTSQGYIHTESTIAGVWRKDPSNAGIIKSCSSDTVISSAENNCWINVSVTVMDGTYSYTITGEDDKKISGSGLWAAKGCSKAPDTLEIQSYSPRNSAVVDIDNIKIYTGNISSIPEPEYQSTPRQMEALDRGTVAVYTGSNVYLSWRLLGTESITNQPFDIYRDREKIYTTGPHDPTNFIDVNGTAASKYIVVPSGADISGETPVTPWTDYVAYSGSSYLKNQGAYIDIPIVSPKPVKASDDIDGYTYSANDASVGDLDGDGQYEIVLKWDPSNSKDNSSPGYTGNVYIDAYETDTTNTGYKWRINLGPNIRAGAHYTQFMVYDLNGDGKAEVAMKTAPGSVDGKGNYVTEAGVTENIRNASNDTSYKDSSGFILTGPEYLTIFDGETGAALCTVDYAPPRSVQEMDKDGWGDDYGGRSERYLACVAYLDGIHPSLVMIRGYYTHAYFAAYTWDGSELKQQWLSANTKKESEVTYYDGRENVTEQLTLYGQGNHNLSVSDVDDDGKDEIVFGSGVLDDDGTVLNSTGHGHGDAMHVSDFDNDGNQEVFQVHEGNYTYGAELRDASDGKIIAYQTVGGDNGRGIMDNLYDSGDAYSQFASAGVNGIYNFYGDNYDITLYIEKTDLMFLNFMMYWDEDLGRELLDENKLGKLTASKIDRIVWGHTTTWFPGSWENNGDKANPCLSADIFGDWREEVIFRSADENGSPTLRIFMSAEPTQYRLYTLMHDSQYRLGIAWQNVAYNQPPHTSYYIGSKALAKTDTGMTLNYIVPNTAYTNVDTSIHAEVNGTTAVQSPVYVPAEVFHGIDENGKEIETNYASLADNIKITAGDLAVTGFKVFVKDDNGADEFIGSTGNSTAAEGESENRFTTITNGSSAVIAVIVDGISTEQIGIQVIE